MDLIRQNVPNIKHLSINTVPLTKKFIKKVKEIRYFHKPTSVFANWREDTINILTNCFATDVPLMKLKRFIKDETEYSDTI